MQSVYARNIYKANSEIPHILVCGDVEVSTFKFFCHELFHPDHGGQDKVKIIYYIKFNSSIFSMRLFCKQIFRIMKWKCFCTIHNLNYS